MDTGSQPFGSDRQQLLLASIHDVGPRFESEVDRLADVLVRAIGAPRFAMLVVPNHWGEAPLDRAPAFGRRLREWSDAGIEMFVHGWFHKDLASHSRMNGFKARTMTAGEGEFLGLDQTVAAQRMADGKALVEDLIGRPAAGFIAPAWLYGAGAKAALATSGYAIAEDHMRVWEPVTGKQLARGPVITWASRSRPRQLSSRAFAGVARHLLHSQRVVRLAVHPGDTGVPSLLSSIAATLSAFTTRRAAGRYSDLLSSGPIA